MEKLHKSMNLYVKAISKRNEVEDKEKSLPIGHVGRVMINHGEDFENDSEFGQSLISARPALRASTDAKCLQVSVALKKGLHGFRRLMW